MCATDLPIARPTAYPDSTIGPVLLPSCVTPVNTLAAPAKGRVLAQGHPPEGFSPRIRTLSITGLTWAVLRQLRIINLMSIDYACRPRLRSRLTQGRLA